MKISSNYSTYSMFYDRLNKKKMLSFAKKLSSFVERNKLDKINSILDIGCGSGMILNYLTKKINPEKYSLGVDLSPEMIHLAKINYPNLSWEVQDMLDLKINFEPDLIICSNDVINYLNLNDIKNFFKKIKSLMHGASLFYLDFDTEKDVTEVWDGQINRIIGKDFEVTIISEYNEKKKIGIETQKWIYKINGEVYEQDEIHHLYPISPEFVNELAKNNKLLIKNFIDPVNLSIIDNFIDLNAYLRLGCIFSKI